MTSYVLNRSRELTLTGGELTAIITSCHFTLTLLPTFLDSIPRENPKVKNDSTLLSALPVATTHAARLGVSGNSVEKGHMGIAWKNENAIMRSELCWCHIIVCFLQYYNLYHIYVIMQKRNSKNATLAYCQVVMLVSICVSVSPRKEKYNLNRLIRLCWPKYFPPTM